MTRMWVISASLHRVVPCERRVPMRRVTVGYTPPTPHWAARLARLLTYLRPQPGLHRSAARPGLRSGAATGSRRSSADRLPVTYSGAKGETSLPQARVMSRSATRPHVGSAPHPRTAPYRFRRPQGHAPQGRRKPLDYASVDGRGAVTPPASAVRDHPRPPDPGHWVSRAGFA